MNVFTLETIVGFAGLIIGIALIMLIIELIHLYKKIKGIEQIQTMILKKEIDRIKMNAMLVPCNDGKKRNRKELEAIYATFGRKEND